MNRVQRNGVNDLPDLLVWLGAAAVIFVTATLTLVFERDCLELNTRTRHVYPYLRGE